MEEQTLFGKEFMAELERKDKEEKAEKEKKVAEEFKLTKEQIKELKTLEPSVANEILETSLTYDEIKRSGKNLAATENIKKIDYCKKLAGALCTPSSFYEYYNSFSDEEKKFFLEMAFSPVFNTKQIIKSVLDATDYRYSSYYYYDNNCSKLPLSFLINYHYLGFYVIPKNTKKCLQIYFSNILNHKSEISNEEFEKQKGYFSYKNGLELLLNLPQLIQVLSDVGFFNREIGQTIPKTILSKVEKVVSFTKFPKGQEFMQVVLHKDEKDTTLYYGEKEIETMKNARTIFAISFVSSAVQSLYSTENGEKEFSALLYEPQKLLKKLVNAFFVKRNFMFDRKFIFPHVTFRSGYSYNVNDYREIFSIIKENPPEKPTNFNDYVSLLSDKGLKPFYCMQTTYSEISYAYENEYSYYGMYRDRIYIKDLADYNAFVQNPSCTNLFLTFASLGLFEITWENSRDNPKAKTNIVEWQNAINFYRFGKISYIKITELGKFVFGITDKIEIEGVKKYAPPTLDKSSLIIHIEEGDKSSQIFLEQFCIPLSHTLYKADEMRLKKMCKTEDDVETIFYTLSERAEGNLPEIWENLKNDILESFVTLKPETDWIVFSLEKQNSSLMREMEKLSRLGICKKMEGKRVAVKEKDFSQFKKRLEQSGFKF